MGLRNLHLSIPTDLIRSELEKHFLRSDKYHKASISLIKTRYRCFRSTQNLHLIQTKSSCSILHTKIKIEESYNFKTISQCTNCQNFEHTNAYYGYSPCCVCCGNDHHSSARPKTRHEPTRCAFFQENYPTNYKGCSVF